MSDALERLNRVKKRRVTDPNEIKGWSRYDVDSPIRFGGGVLFWIDEYTTGRFYVDTGTIAFENDEDLFAFRLGFGRAKDRI